RLPVFVAALTTALGFLSLAVNPISSIREMGIYASIGVAIAGALALVLVPAVLCLLPPPRAAAGAPGPLDGALRALGRADVRHRTAIAALAAVIVAASLACALRIRVDSSYASFFRPDDPIRRATDAIHRNLVGTMAFLVVVDGREPGVLKKLDALKRIRDLQRFVDGLPGVDKTISFIDYLELLDRGSQNPSGDILISPDGKIAETPAAAEKTTLWENLAQYSAVMELVNSSPRSFSMVVNADFTRTAILVRTTLTSSSDVAATADRILAYAAERFPPELAVHPTGNLILLTHTTGNLVAGQVQSFAIAGGVIFAILSGMFLSARIGFLAMLPNLFPIVFFFGLMGLSGAALNVGTSIIASIALGLAVHNTIHIMARLSAEVRRTDDSERAIVDALASVGKPAVASSVLLFFGFLALGLSRFVPIQQFGLLSAATAVAGLFGDLLLLPALLASTRIITLWDLLYLRLGRDPHKTIPLFATLRPAQAKIVALMGRLQRFADGEPIVRQGDVGHEMFVLLSGAAEVRVSTNGRTHRVRELRRGDVFGEMALIRHHTRSADVLAIDDVEVMALDERFLDRVQRRYPRIAAALFLNLSKILSDRLEQETGRARA
ncbi:MAG: uncharacterized protein QOD06_372, partial [Candidatus Binatota bacterium]|nr:uncharacterized protein [Candidatus Binatota bacterium]